MFKKKNQKGFTLVELLVVIAIIGILAVVAVPALFKNINKAKVADLQADYNAIKSATLSYYTEKNEIPVDGAITSLNGYMDNVPTKSGLGEGAYTFKEDKLDIAENNKKSLFLVVGDKELKKDDKCNENIEHTNECYTKGKGVTLTADQSKKLKVDMGDGMVYVNTSSADSNPGKFQPIEDTSSGNNVILAIKLIDNTSKVK